MPAFGKVSLKILQTCDNRLQDICHEAIKLLDFSVISGYRGEVEQTRIFEEGFSKNQFPHSRHNVYPSGAVDIAPWPIDWEDEDRFHRLAGVMQGIALMMGHKLTYGGDWDNDGILTDQSFNDLGHFQLEEF